MAIIKQPIKVRTAKYLGEGLGLFQHGQVYPIEIFLYPTKLEVHYGEIIRPYETIKELNSEWEPA